MARGMRKRITRFEEDTVVYVKRQRPDEPTDELRFDDDFELIIDISAFEGLEMFESF
jgi:hypothetical protein